MLITHLDYMNTKKYIKNLFRSQVLSVPKSIADCESVPHFLFKKNPNKLKLFSWVLVYGKHDLTKEGCIFIFCFFSNQIVDLKGYIFQKLKTFLANLDFSWCEPFSVLKWE